MGSKKEENVQLDHWVKSLICILTKNSVNYIG